jgi:hippurate hydrolase
VTLDSALLEHLVAIRRELHRYPEVGWNLARTAALIERELGALGIASRRVAGTGVLADLTGAAEGPFVALRADMDALPIDEMTGRPFASAVPGLMHACGHDGHVSALLGAAALLRQDPPSLPVRLVFQPAEETAEGARAMIDAGALEDVTSIFGLHLDIGLAVGEIATPEGPVNASTDEFTILITGPGGHAARPDETADPIVAAGFLLTQLQTIVSRRVPPFEPAVLTVGRVDAGVAANVIAERARLDGTIRAVSRDARRVLIEAVHAVASGIGPAHGVDVAVELLPGTPAVINRPRPTAIARSGAADVVGADGLRTSPLRNMGGEDFGFYLERVEGAFVRIGARLEDGEERRAHSSRFDFDEHALGIAAAYLARVAHAAGRVHRGSSA